MMPGAYQIDYWVIISPPGGFIEGFSGVLGRFEPFFSRLEPNFSRKSPNLCTFQISQMSNFNRGKIVKRGATVRVPMIARGPVVRHPVDPIMAQSPTNLPEQAPTAQYTPPHSSISVVIEELCSFSCLVFILYAASVIFLLLKKDT